MKKSSDSLFRPCIDIHKGSVKQIVGSTLGADEDRLQENFIAEHKADYYANLYRKDNLLGGHLIMLGGKDDEVTKLVNERTARQALRAYPGGLQIGGGIGLENAITWLEAGASAVIITSYLFDKKGWFSLDRLKTLAKKIGRDKIVVDLSCQKINDGSTSSRSSNRYYACMAGWQKMTHQALDEKLFEAIAPYCLECLIHSVAVEGKMTGCDEDLINYLSQTATLPCVYAGGISSWDDIARIKNANRQSKEKIYYTIGSALDIFGGKQLCYQEVIRED